MELNIDKLKPFSAIAIFQVVFVGIVSGLLFLFIFSRPLFLSLDYFRLIVVGIAIAGPILALNIFLFHDFSSPSTVKQTNDRLHKTISASAFLGSLLSCCIIYVPILIGYLFHLEMRSGVIILVSLEAIVCLLFFLMAKKII